jgi:geranylgeranyl diphosphate synthase type I
MTLMAVKALEEANDEDSDTLLKILKNDNSSKEDISIAISIYEKYGSIQYANDVAIRNVNQAKELLNILPDTEAKHMLSLIAEYVLERHS